tara:strand:+ start:457 stop:744 length:288 start_codon:yes stop_codon:yes gene_type:complete
MKNTFLKELVKNTRERWIGGLTNSSKDIIRYDRNNSIIKYDEKMNVYVPYKRYEYGFVKRNSPLPFIYVPHKRYENPYIITTSNKPYKRYEDRIN